MLRMPVNLLTQQFYEDLRERYPVDGSDVSYSEWVARNTRLGLKQFSYEGYEFQRQIVDDMATDLSVKKPSQVGMTEVQIRKFLAFLVRNRGTSGIFSFPSEKMFKKNSKTRIKPIVSQPAFNASSIEDDKPTRSMDLYEIGGSFAHITGLTEGDATSTPADIVFNDELDLSDQQMIGLMQSRLQNSRFKITQKFSTPTHPGYGIDASYNASNQFRYMVRCRCSHWQDPKFELPFLHLDGYHGDGKLDELDADGVSHINLGSSYVKCERCSQALNLGDPSLREWVAKYEARRARGYAITPFCTSRLTIDYILDQLLKQKALDNISGWHNTVLGETHSDGTSKLEPDVVRAIMRGAGIPEISKDTPVALGGDMGRTCHLTLGAISGQEVSPFLFEQVPSSKIQERISYYRAKYRIVCGAVDRHPYTPTSEAIRDATKGVILPVEYRGEAPMNLKEDEYGALSYVQVNRTRVIDNLVRAVQGGTFEMRGYGGLEQIVIEHLCDMVRVEADEKPATWQKLTGSDHFLHSLALLRASVKISDFVAETTRGESKPLFGMSAVPTARFPGLNAKRQGVLDGQRRR